jgi:hypothetical protein
VDANNFDDSDLWRDSDPGGRSRDEMMTVDDVTFQ